MDREDDVPREGLPGRIFPRRQVITQRTSNIFDFAQEAVPGDQLDPSLDFAPEERAPTPPPPIPVPNLPNVNVLNWFRNAVHIIDTGVPPPAPAPIAVPDAAPIPLPYDHSIEELEQMRQFLEYDSFLNEDDRFEALLRIDDQIENLQRQKRPATQELISPRPTKKRVACIVPPPGLDLNIVGDIEESDYTGEIRDNEFFPVAITDYDYAEGEKIGIKERME